MIIEYFLIGSLGAFAFEILKLYDLMGKLTKRKYKALIYSKLYWITVLGMIIASGFIAWGINSEAENATTWQLIISGIGARSLVSKPIEIHNSNKGIQLGDTEEDKITLKDIF